MTNKEAINHLEYLKVDSHIAKVEALDLAIKALEERQDYEDSFKALEIAAKKAREAIEVFKQGLDKAEEQAKRLQWRSRYER